MYLQKVTSRKNCVKKLFFPGILKVNDENSRIRIQDPDPNPDLSEAVDPDPDPHQNVMDPERCRKELILRRDEALKDLKKER
jgi:hypothetical protein